MKSMDIGARSMFLVDLELIEPGCLARKNGSGAVYSRSELSQRPHKTIN